MSLHNLTKIYLLFIHVYDMMWFIKRASVKLSIKIAKEVCIQDFNPLY